MAYTDLLEAIRD